MEMIKSFFQAFLPLFVAIDVIAILPMFLSLTYDFTEQERRTLVTNATVTALVVSVVFLFAGKLLFSFLGINENDFRVAGGLVLLVISVLDLTTAHKEQIRKLNASSGIVPIGIPLIVGPAALTTILISVDNYGYGVTLVALLVNLAIVWITFRHSALIVRICGEAGSKAIGKVMALFLAAIAVMMIRVGLSNFLSTGVSP